MSGGDDAELSRRLRAALAGDEKAYADFLHRAAALVRGFVRKRAGQGSIDPEDIVQETLLAIHLKRHTWRTDAPVGPWLYAIARFKLIDAFRRIGRRVVVDVDAFSDTLASPEAEETASPRDVERALATLAPGQRAVVESISVDGNSISETAHRLGMQETAVRVALHRGLAAIARRFGSG
ncbi:MAG: sigma-70 family RNA polymerase sigma factor [Rhizobiaceae bacterium]